MNSTHRDLQHEFLNNKILDLREKLAESEAGAAGMRRALEDVADNNRRPFSLHSIRAIAQVALSKTDAGKEMLEVVECAREFCLTQDEDCVDTDAKYDRLKRAAAAVNKKMGR